MTCTSASLSGRNDYALTPRPPRRGHPSSPKGKTTQHPKRAIPMGHFSNDMILNAKEVAHTVKKQVTMSKLLRRDSRRGSVMLYIRPNLIPICYDIQY